MAHLPTLAIEKLALAGERAGFTVEQMIQILNAGVSLESLIDLIERVLQGIARTTDCSSRWIM